FEQVGGSLARRRCKDRRIHQQETVRVEEVADRANDFRSDRKNRVLPFRSQPQMPVVHQELRAVFLWGYRIIVSDLQDFDAGHIKLVAAGRALIGSNPARHNDRGFLGELFEIVPHLLRDVLLKDDALNDSRTVAYLRKDQLAARSAVVKPSLDHHLFTDMRGDIPNVCLIHCSPYWSDLKASSYYTSLRD